MSTSHGKPLLRKPLMLWLGSALALGSIGFRVVAQAPYNPPAETNTPFATTGEAAQLFGRLLQINGQQDEMVTGSADYYLKYRLISQKDRQQLGMPAIDVLLQDLTKNQKPAFESSAARQEGGKTVVDITPKTLPAPAPVVLVAEGGGYRVDLLATYAKRLQLDKNTLENAIYERTGIALEGYSGRNIPSYQKDICQTNLKEIALGMSQYSQDYDEKLPPAKGWTDVLQPYVRSKTIFTCPALPKSQSNGYAFNAALSGQYEPKLPNTSKIVSIYETTLLKPNAYGMGENLSFRHESGANFAFADGHVKWFTKTQIPSLAFKP